jgi:hypothetical protein
MQQTRIYPLGKRESAMPMQFPNASRLPANMLYPADGSAFDMLARFIDHEYADPADMEMRGVLATLGIQKGKPFDPDSRMRALLHKGAKTAYRIGRSLIYEPLVIVPNALWYPDRRWASVFPGNATFTAPTFNYIDPRTGFFTAAYSTSPGMAVNMENVGAKYPVTFVDAQGDFLQGANRYRLRLPKDIPVALFWSVTVYDPVTGSGLDNGQPFPSINTMDKPAANADGSTDIYFGPSSPRRREELAENPAGQGVLRDPAPVRPHQGLLRQELEAERYRARRRLVATGAFADPVGVY